MFSIRHFKGTSDPDAALVFEIRQKVFVEEQKVSRDEEYDEYENSSEHYLLSVNNEPAGTARWRFTPDGIKLERFAVLPQFRNQGSGSFIVNSVLADVLPHNKKIYLNSQVSAMNLYRKAGFVEEGELFYEAGIPHYRMVLQQDQ